MAQLRIFAVIHFYTWLLLVLPGLYLVGIPTWLCSANLATRNFSPTSLADSSSASLDLVVAFGVHRELSYVMTARLVISLASTSTVTVSMMLKSARR
jgi:hypothetical protein